MSELTFDAMPAVTTEGELRPFLDRLDAAFARINDVQTKLTWAKIFNEPYDPATQQQIDRAKDDLYTAANHETIRTWRDKTSDPYLKRWTEVLDDQYTFARLEQQPEIRTLVNHLTDRYIQWRPKIDDTEITYTEHTRINRLEPDRDLRRKAYRAMWDLGNELAGVTRELFHLRNAAAKTHGYPTYADMKLALVDGIDRDWLMGHFNQMESITAETFESYLQQQAAKEGISDIQPWDSQYLLDRDSWPDPKYYPADSMGENLFAAATSLGLDSEALGIRHYFYDSAAGGQCVTYAPGDIRILSTKGDGMLHYNTAFHEYGHGIHSAFYDQPYTLRRETNLFTEGIAMFMERFLHYPTWMRRTGVPEADIQQHRENWKLPRIYRHRRLAPMVMAEFAAWDNPDGDIDQVFGEQTARYLGTAVEPRPFAAVTRWTHPMQMQGYFIADVIASQAHAYLQANLPSIYDSPDAIEHARVHYLAPGNSIPWLQKIRNGTGEDLSYAALARDMTNPFPDA